MALQPVLCALMQRAGSTLPESLLNMHACAAAGSNGQKVRLICVPKFSTSGILLLVNLTTLEVEPVAFDTYL